VLDTDAFLPRVQVTDDLAAEAGGDGAAERYAPTEEAQHVGAAEGGHGVLQQAWVQPP